MYSLCKYCSMFVQDIVPTHVLFVQDIVQDIVPTHVQFVPRGPPPLLLPYAPMPCSMFVQDIVPTHVQFSVCARYSSYSCTVQCLCKI